MSSRPASRTSTSSTVRGVVDSPVRPPTSNRDRQEFLELALSRLNLGSPRPPSPSPVKPSFEPLGSKTSGPSSAPTEPLDSNAAASSSSSVPSSRAPASLHSLSGSRTTSAITQELLSSGRDDAESLANEIVLSALEGESSFGDDGEEAGFEGSERLLFYRGLVIQFGLHEENGVPSSVKGCKDLLRTVHICIQDYLAVLEKGGNVRTEVQRHDSAAALARYLRKGKDGERFVALDLVKRELLNPFLVTVFVHK
ncbi:hypothetical protein JCM8097_005438 [Rhodosporidiobolus ruineniae]